MPIWVFRSEEVLNIRMSHIHIREGCMIIKVEKSTTDQLQQGHQVMIAQSGDSVCPVFLLKTNPRKLDIDPRMNFREEETAEIQANIETQSSEFIFPSLKQSPPTS